MDIFENWTETKDMLLAGLSDNKKKLLAPVLENQLQHLRETAEAGSTSAGNIANFQKIVIPMIRRIIPGTIATELVGVQPMTGPVGVVYSMRYVYAESVAGDPPVGTLDQGFVSAAGDEVFANNSKSRRFYSSSDVAAPAGGPGSPSSSGLASTTTGYESFGGRAVTIETLKQTVTAGTRKLQARWTPEAQQDMKASQGLDIQAEITAGLSAAIVGDIDNEVINDLIALAGTTDSFDMAATTFTGVPNYVGDRHAVLGILINRVANEIGRKTRRDVANWIVVSPLVASVLQSAAKSVFAPAVSGSFQGPNNTKLIGTLNGAIKVYTYLYHDTGSEPVLVGYKGGDGELDSGYFYCPYIPLVNSGIVISPTTFNPHMSLSTRYGKATFTSSATSLGNSADYYGRISIANLSFM